MTDINGIINSLNKVLAMSSIEAEAEVTAIKQHAKLVADKLSIITEDEAKSIIRGMSDPMAIIASELPMVVGLACRDELFNMALTAALIGYYMGKTGDMLEGV